MSKMGEIAAGLYPDGLPGWKTPGTSRDAAKAMRSRSETLRDKIMAIIGYYPADLTPDEASEALNESVLAIRPRFSELKKLGLIKPSGNRRHNSSGLMAKAWTRA